MPIWSFVCLWCVFYCISNGFKVLHGHLARLWCGLVFIEVGEFEVVTGLETVWCGNNKAAMSKPPSASSSSAAGSKMALLPGCGSLAERQVSLTPKKHNILSASFVVLTVSASNFPVLTDSLLFFYSHSKLFFFSVSKRNSSRFSNILLVAFCTLEKQHNGTVSY